MNDTQRNEHLRKSYKLNILCFISHSNDRPDIESKRRSNDTKLHHTRLYEKRNRLLSTIYHLFFAKAFLAEHLFINVRTFCTFLDARLPSYSIITYSFEREQCPWP